MKRTIWKFQLEIKDEQSILMPAGAEILTVQVQHGIPCVWALVLPSVPMEQREFRIYGTGHPVDDSEIFLSYIGTYQLQEGSLVFHVFERNL